MEEIWKDVVGFEGLYLVSNLGKVRSLVRGTKLIDKSEGIMAKTKHKGYEYVNIWKDGKCKKGIVHRLVAQAFIPNPENKPCVNHKDFNRSNNSVENLEWVTYRENIRHRNDACDFTSKYFGVCLDKASSKWYAGITHNKKQKALGYFETEYEAHLAYEAALAKLLKTGKL